MKKIACVILTLRCCLLAAQEPTQIQDDLQKLAVQNSNDAAGFMVRVSVDQKDRVYRVGETLSANVLSAKDGFLYLFYIDSRQNVAVVFPNNIQTDNRIAARSLVTVPSKESHFRFRIGLPTGNEVLRAVVTTKPMAKLNAMGLTTASKKSISDKAYIDVERELSRAHTPTDWAEHSVKLRIVKGNDGRARKPSRHLVAIGIQEYKQHQRIPPLNSPARDAKRFAKVMLERGEVDKATVLINSDATLTAIERAVRIDMKANTKPGDTVFIYWSGHGTTISDTNGDEKDGIDECLVPYDADISTVSSVKNSLLVDDRFGRWVQDLDGRTVVLILEACYAGGQSAGAKSLSTPGANAAKNFDFFDSELIRTRDIDQRDTAIIASSRSSELSHQRPNGGLATMTHFLIRKMEETDDTLTLESAFEYVRDEVPRHLKRKLGSTTNQTPYFLNQLSKPVLLVP